jgi:hypothetical protein
VGSGRKETALRFVGGELNIIKVYRMEGGESRKI